MARQVGDLPNALDDGETLARRFAGKRLAVFLDYDGTLTPIRDRPQDAMLSDSMREVVRRLAEQVPVSWSAAATAKSCSSSWASTT